MGLCASVLSLSGALTFGVSDSGADATKRIRRTCQGGVLAFLLGSVGFRTVADMER